MKKVLILEDNQDAREDLVRIVKGVDGDARVEATDNKERAYTIAMENSIDLFLVDIILNPDDTSDVSGLTFAQNIRLIEKYKYTPIIFITSLFDSKYYAYADIHCYQFIEKPFDIMEVRAAISQAIGYNTNGGSDRTLFFRYDGLLEAVNIRDIIYIQARGHNVELITTMDRVIVPYKSCKEIMKELDSDNFIHCHRSVIVNKEYIRRVDPINRYVLLHKCKDVLEIGPTFKKKFLGELGG